MEEVEKARKKAEKLGILHWLDDDDHWLVLDDDDNWLDDDDHWLDDDYHWLVYIARLIDSLMSSDLLIDDRNLDWYVCNLIPQWFHHIVAYYCYLH